MQPGMTSLRKAEAFIDGMSRTAESSVRYTMGAPGWVSSVDFGWRARSGARITIRARGRGPAS